MNGAQWVVHALRAQGVNTVFGYPGGANYAGLRCIV
ncbi:acetolactate synthase II [Escherichia coli]|uniref:Acetolactate synthase II n=1 Tax=Escherichia coli TaxID=562 RepID=A0A376TPG9_ECOLX|nr:acetolactate synthase II [Escherichia coli]